MTALRVRRLVGAPLRDASGPARVFLAQKGRRTVTIQRADRCEELERLAEPCKEQSLAGVVISEAG